MDADQESQDNLGIIVNPDVQQMWRERMSADARMKHDDLGDALLHALNEILCGGSNYKQLVPANTSLDRNRTVVVCVEPVLTFWAVVHCTWNLYELENFGCYESSFDRMTSYRSAKTIRTISGECQRADGSRNVRVVLR